MKTLTTILLCILVSCSTNKNTTIGYEYQKESPININATPIENIDMCAERGHVSPGWVSSTAVYCPPYLIETDSTTIKVFPSCNTITYTCVRCGKLVHEREKERRVVIWKKD